MKGSFVPGAGFDHCCLRLTLDVELTVSLALPGGRGRLPYCTVMARVIFMLPGDRPQA